MVSELTAGECSRFFVAARLVDLLEAIGTRHTSLRRIISWIMQRLKAILSFTTTGLETGIPPSRSRTANGERLLICSRLSGYVNGVALQVEVLSQLVKLVKTGQYTGSIGTPKSVVVLGFSFGSVVTNTLVSNEPTLMDGAVFTGLGYSPTAFAPFLEAYQPRIASLQNPDKFGQLDTGSLTWVDIFANINS